LLKVPPRAADVGDAMQECVIPTRSPFGDGALMSDLDPSRYPALSAVGDEGQPQGSSAVTAPEGVQGNGEGSEKRRFPRAPVQLAVQMKFGSVQEFMNATAEDLSAGGIFLRSQHFAANEVHELGQLITLQFDAGSRRVVQGVGKVVRVVRPGPGVIAGVALEFVEIDETSQRLVEAIVDIKLATTPHSR
jgi:hypothetical protein